MKFLRLLIYYCSLPLILAKIRGNDDDVEDDEEEHHSGVFTEDEKVQYFQNQDHLIYATVAVIASCSLFILIYQARKTQRQWLQWKRVNLFTDIRAMRGTNFGSNIVPDQFDILSSPLALEYLHQYLEYQQKMKQKSHPSTHNFRYEGVRFDVQVV